MKIISGSADFVPSTSDVVLTIGNFDGVHLGHQKIIRLAVSQAQARGGISIAYTFKPHPRAFLYPESRPSLLTPEDEKRRILKSLGLDVLIEEPFSRDFSTMPAERFFKEILIGRVGARALVVGYDFSFGRDREGHLSELDRLCQLAGIQLTVVEQLKLDDEVISSTQIRKLLLAGQVDAAARLLGREYSYTGIVTQGEGRGRKLGYPTANLKVGDQLSLPHGVYATRALVDGWTYASITNVGVRPTFRAEGADELPELVETHLLDVSVDLYGKKIEVQFVSKIRNEQKFGGISALQAQIAQDVQTARKVLQGAFSAS